MFDHRDPRTGRDKRDGIWAERYRVRHEVVIIIVLQRAGNIEININDFYKK